LTTLLCQSLDLNKALPIVGRLRGLKDNSIAGGIAAIDVSIARAALLSGEFKTCRKVLGTAEEGIRVDEAYVEPEDGAGDDDQAATGGKRSWKTTDETRDLSLQVRIRHNTIGINTTFYLSNYRQVFREHRRSELVQDIQIIRSFLEGEKAKSRSSAEFGESVLSFYKRIFLFDIPTQSVGRDKVVKRLQDVFRESLGLDECIKHTMANYTPELFGKQLEIFSRHQDSCIDHSGFLKFNEIFSDTAPVKLVSISQQYSPHT